MASHWRADPWGYRLVFIGIGLLLLFAQILPLGTPAGRLPGPDVLLCIILAWSMRRPDFIPVWVLLPMLLLGDLLLMRPPGLWTLLVVLAVEFLRARVAMTRELNFVVEWLLAAGLMLILLLAYRSVHVLAFIPQLPFGFAAVQLIGSILAYPLVVGLSRLAFDLKKPGTGEVDDYGRRL